MRVQVAYLLLSFLAAALPAGGQNVSGLAAAGDSGPTSVRVLPEKERIYLGESMSLSLLVEGDANPDAPVLPLIEDFHVRFVRGRATENDGRPGYVFQYDVVPRRSGELLLPPIPVYVAGTALETEPLAITVLVPEETDALRVESSLSKTRCYVGEALTLTVTWYCALPLRSVKAVDLRAPILRDARFDVFLPADGIDPTAPTAVGLPVNETRVITERGETEIDGTRFATLRFVRRVVPREAGQYEIDGGMVYCAALAAGVRSRRAWNQYPSYFDNDFFDKDLSGEYVRHFATGNPFSIEVLPLPSEGAPEYFTGLVAEDFRIEARLEQDTVAAGAPVKLTLTLRAASAIEHATAPRLATQTELARDFDLPFVRPLGRIEGDAIVFTHTLRPLHTKIEAVPPIRIAYFDPARETYATAETAPLPITIEAAHAVTAFEAEGAGEKTLRRALERDEAAFQELRGGVALLADDRGRIFGWGGMGFWLLVLVLPPLPFLWIAGRMAYIRYTTVPPDALRAHNAHGAFKKRMAKAPVPAEKGPEAAYSGIEHALRGYLGDRLRLSAKTLTYPDVRPPLEQRKIEGGLLARLRRIFDECLAHRFSGGHHAGGAHRDDLEETQACIRELEEKLR